MKNIMMMGMLFVGVTYAVTITTEVVVDSKTKLEWQNQPVNKTNQVNWSDAIDYCENLELDEKSDWRLPNINELKSLVDYKTFNPAIVSTLKETSSSKKYWSSTNSFYPSSAHIVDFFYGNNFYLSKSNSDIYVRCVRDN